MKKILIVLFAISSMSLFAQNVDSPAKKFKFVDKVNDSMFLAEFENDMFIKLKINGMLVRPDSFSNYKTFIDKAQASYEATKNKTPYYGSKQFKPSESPQNLDVWERKFKESLEADGLVSLKEHYKIEFGDILLRINGKTVDDKTYQKYLNQYKEITGVDLNMGFTLDDK